MTDLHQERMDANEAAFLSRQLDVVMARTYERRYNNLKARIHFPVNREGGPGAETLTAEFYDAVGQAAIVSSYSADWPQVDIKAGEFQVKVKSLGDSYSFSFQDVRSAMLANRDLEARKANAARRAIAEKENRLAYLGSPEFGLPGAFNNPNVPIKMAAYKIDATSTPDQILQVLNDAINTPTLTTFGTEIANTVLVSVELYTYISSTRVSTLNDKTILAHLEEIHQDKDLEIDWCVECKGAAPNGADIMFVYTRDEEHIELRIPSDFEQLPPFSDGKVTTVNCHERFAGVFIPYPLSALVVQFPL